MRPVLEEEGAKVFVIVCRGRAVEDQSTKQSFRVLE
jgi:hypothetical protein